MIYEIQQSPKMVKSSRITSSFQWYLMEIFVELCQSQVWHQARPPAKWYTDTFRKQLISQQTANLEPVLEFYNRGPLEKIWTLTFSRSVGCWLEFKRNHPPTKKKAGEEIWSKSPEFWKPSWSLRSFVRSSFFFLFPCQKEMKQERDPNQRSLILIA